MKRLTALLLLTGLILSGCGGEPQIQTDPQIEVVMTTQPQEKPPATEEIQLPEETLPPETEAPAPEDEFSRHSGIREDGTFGSGALFVGDFLTYGLVTGYLNDESLLGDARYMIVCNAALPAFYYGPTLTASTPGCLYSPEFKGLLLSEALPVAGEDTTAIYFMIGTNASQFATDKMMLDIVDLMLESCPNATVYLQLVPFDRSTQVDHEEANRRMLATYLHYQREENPRVMLIDTQTAIGYNLTTDGIQLTTEGQACWYQALVAFSDGNGIPE